MAELGDKSCFIIYDDYEITSDSEGSGKARSDINSVSDYLKYRREQSSLDFRDRDALPFITAPEPFPKQCGPGPPPIFSRPWTEKDFERPNPTIPIFSHPNHPLCASTSTQPERGGKDEATGSSASHFSSSSSSSGRTGFSSPTGCSSCSSNQTGAGCSSNCSQYRFTQLWKSDQASNLRKRKRISPPLSCAIPSPPDRPTTPNFPEQTSKSQELSNGSSSSQSNSRSSSPCKSSNNPSNSLFPHKRLKSSQSSSSSHSSSHHSSTSSSHSSHPPPHTPDLLVSEQAIESALHQAMAMELTQYGFRAFQQDALDTMCDVTKGYIMQFGKILRKHMDSNHPLSAHSSIEPDPGYVNEITDNILESCLRHLNTSFGDLFKFYDEKVVNFNGDVENDIGEVKCDTPSQLRFMNGGGDIPPLPQPPPLLHSGPNPRHMNGMCKSTLPPAPVHIAPVRAAVHAPEPGVNQMRGADPKLNHELDLQLISDIDFDFPLPSAGTHSQGSLTASTLSNGDISGVASNGIMSHSKPFEIVQNNVLLTNHTQTRSS